MLAHFCRDIDWVHNQFTSGGLFYNKSLDRSISNSRVSGYFLLLLYFIEIPLFNADSIDPGQMPRSVILIWACTVCQLPFGGFPD